MARGMTARSRRARPSARPLLWRWLLLGALILVVLAVVVARSMQTDRGGDGALATLTTSDFHALVFSPTDPDVVLFGHHNGVLRSEDGGQTWRPLVERRNFDGMSLAASRANPQHLYLAGHDVFQASVDGGATWQPVAHNLPGTDIHAFTLSPDDPARLSAFVVNHGVFQSGDGGRTWQRVAGQLPGDITALASAGGNPEVLYAGSAHLGVLRSADGGQSWVPVAAGLGGRGVYALAVDSVARTTIYAGLEDGAYRSADAGASWTRLPFPGGNAVALAVSPARPGRVLAISVRQQQGFVYRSEDGGQTWGRRK